MVKPWVLESFCSRDTFVFLAENSRYQILNLITDFIPAWSIHAVNAILDSLNDLLVRVSIEWRLSTKQNVENDTDTPHVTLFAVGTLNDFGGDIIRGSEDSVHRVLVVNTARSTKIDQFDDRVFLILEMYVLRLDVSMNDIVLMEVVDS